MAIVPSLTYSQSTDGSTLTFTDTSTGDRTGYTREVELYSGKDGTGSLITTLEFADGSSTVTYDITADQYWSAKLVYTGSPSVTPIYLNFTSQQFEQNLLNDKLSNNCGCQTNLCNSTFFGFIYMYTAQVATSAGNSGLANSFITASKSWLSQ